MDASLTDLFCYLISGRANDFYARVLSSMGIEPSSNVPMMGVRVRSRHYVLMYNPAWVEKAPHDDIIATIQHEAYHVIFQHIPRLLTLIRKYKHDPKLLTLLRKIFPFSLDLAVNTLLIDVNDYVKAHRNEWVLPGQAPFKSMPKHQSMEWYTQELTLQAEEEQEKREEGQKRLEDALQEMLDGVGYDDAANGKGMYGEDEEENDDAEDGENVSGSGGAAENDEEVEDEQRGGEGEGEGEDEDGEDGDGGKGAGKDLGLGFQLLANHAGWEDEDANPSDESLSSLIDELEHEGKTLVKNAVEMHAKAHGTVPAGLQEVIAKLLREPQIPWSRIFRNIVASAQRTRRRRTLGRPRRRHVGIDDLVPFPGKKKDYTYHVAFCIDTSGSMGSKELEMALNELRGMCKMDKEMMVTVIEADAAVEREYQIGGPGIKQEIKHDVAGRGGTSFDPALLRAQELTPRIDAAFYFTDGYAPEPAKESRVPCTFSWLITPTGKSPTQWGQVINTKPYA